MLGNKNNDGVDFFLKMRNSYKFNGKSLEYKLRKTGLMRTEIAAKLVEDKENNLNTEDAALTYIRNLICESEKHDDNILASIKKILGE
jgi:hypothetical protein